MCAKRKASSPLVSEWSGRISSLRASDCSSWTSPGASSGGHSSDTAPHQKTRPTTAARSITTRSCSSSRSSRAASSAWIVGGTGDVGEVARPPPSRPRRRSSPSSTSIRSISSTNNGLPSAASAMPRADVRAATPPARAGSRSASWSRPRSAARAGSGGVAPWPSPSRAAPRRAPAGPGRGSARARRAIQSARYSSRSRNVGSAQWMSSNTTTSGRSAARRSNSRRTRPERLLDGRGRSAPRRAAGASRPAISSPSRSAGEQLVDLGRGPASDESRVGRRRRRRATPRRPART